ncbi:patatin-like phospholipase family protein [Achromobacter pestifer]|nr:patatin-like phospholipase family protein [Achromobacter pestifer]
MKEGAEMRAVSRAAGDQDGDEDRKHGTSDQEALAARARHLAREDGGDGPQSTGWGLALSGGGIRSATFCFGLLRALARNRVLRRFDYLSTVSGGGYIGAALGRLYQEGQGAAEVERGLARDDTLLLWWLRSNGRYLKAAGRQDLGQAAASIFRGVVGSHFEVLILLLLAALLINLPNLRHVWPWLPDGSEQLWLWSLALPGSWALVAVLGYWSVGAAAADSTNQGTVSSRRLAWNKQLAQALWLGAILVSLMLARMAAVALYDWMKIGAAPAVAVGAVATSAVAALRFAWPHLQRLIVRKGMTLLAHNAMQLINIAGLLYVAMLLVGLSALMHAATLSDVRWELPGWRVEGKSALALSWLVPLLAVSVFYLWTGKQREVLNLSSLHNFYRARIERAYVSVGNYAAVSKEDARFAESPLQPAKDGATDRVLALLDAAAGDDIELNRYMPQRHGGPIHLMSTCINQTIDDRTRNYNADRKGVALTVSSLGVEIGTAAPISDVAGLGSLSRWVAISGAAASTGMGSRTRPGIAALLFLMSARLGYWYTVPKAVQSTRQEWRGGGESSSSEASRSPRCERPAAWLAGRFPKAAAVLSELLARFPGLRSDAWYVSDGGHFENTGVYALLKRELPLIVVADVGADPKYRCEDLENLVRKARIDYAAEIEFLDASRLPWTQASTAMTTLADLAEHGSEPGCGCLLPALIRYSSGRQGVLLVCKPRVPKQAPLDLASYARDARGSGFPQQSTGDQFFDEAQWEAYHLLGLLTGQHLTATVLEMLARASVQGLAAPRV